MSAPQAAAITACTACAAVGGAAAGGAFSSGSSLENTETNDEASHTHSENTEGTGVSNIPENPNWYPITDEDSGNKSDFSASGKIGKDYEKYLVGAYGTTDKDNTNWWTKSFAKYEEDKKTQSANFSTEFGTGNVTSAFSKKDADGGEKALNRVCYKIYTQEKSTITSTTNTDNQFKLQKDLWAYCSPLGTKPTTVQDAGETSSYSGGSKIGDTKKDKVLATKGNHNTKLWELKNEEFKNLSTTPTGEYFQKVQEKIKATSSPSTLKEECEKAYSLTNSNESTESYETTAKVKDENVVKYCSL